MVFLRQQVCLTPQLSITSVGAGAMKKALLQEMTSALLADVIFALKDDISADEFLSRLLVTLSRDGHGSLLAWLGLENQEINALPTKNNTSELFESII